MYFEEFAAQVRPFTVFESQLVWPFYQSPQQAQRQLTDSRSGRLLQLRRALPHLLAVIREESEEYAPI